MKTRQKKTKGKLGSVVDSRKAKRRAEAWTPHIDEPKLASFEGALKIVTTGKGNDGTEYSSYGVLNQAAWIGENSRWLIEKIHKLKALL